MINMSDDREVSDMVYWNVTHQYLLFSLHTNSIEIREYAKGAGGALSTTRHDLTGWAGRNHSGDWRGLKQYT